MAVLGAAAVTHRSLQGGHQKKRETPASACHAEHSFVEARICAGCCLGPAGSSQCVFIVKCNCDARELGKDKEGKVKGEDNSIEDEEGRAGKCDNRED